LKKNSKSFLNIIFSSKLHINGVFMYLWA